AKEGPRVRPRRRPPAPSVCARLATAARATTLAGDLAMSEEPVDVLIVGAGASAAAFAWGLAGTRVNILWLEQGEWMKPESYPGMRTDWEVRQLGDFALSPNTRGRREDYPVNDGASPIQVSMFNAVGGSTIMYAAHFPRFHPGDFRVKSLDG